jgi:hypothetical protein
MEREDIGGPIEPAPTPGGIDFSTWSYNTLPERTGNAGWQPDLQDLIYTAINHVEGDYEDADANCAEQVIERLVLAIKSLLSKLDKQKAREAELEAQAQAQRDDMKTALGNTDAHGAKVLARAQTAEAALEKARNGARWRPEVAAFADLMEAQLRANDHKPGWKGESAGADLLPRLHEEADELREALRLWAAQVAWGSAALYLPQNIAKVGREAADVANFAMMIADVCGALPSPADS